MPIEIDIAHVARLARLDLTDPELATYQEQLGVILEHAAKVQSLEGDPSHESEHPLEFVNAFRPDEVVEPLDRQEVLDAAPETSDGYFVAPPALNEET